MVTSSQDPNYKVEDLNLIRGSLEPVSISVGVKEYEDAFFKLLNEKFPDKSAIDEFFKGKEKYFIESVKIDSHENKIPQTYRSGPKAGNQSMLGSVTKYLEDDEGNFKVGLNEKDGKINAVSYEVSHEDESYTVNLYELEAISGTEISMAIEHRIRREKENIQEKNIRNLPEVLAKLTKKAENN